MSAARKSPLALGAALLALCLAGCGSTSEHRARQYSTAFGQLSPEAQQRAIVGSIKQGDSREAVYIGLGPPQGQMIIENVEVWEYTARPKSADSKFSKDATATFMTPYSEEWTGSWGEESGYLSIEFEDGLLDRWDYTAGGYQMPINTERRIILPPTE